MSPAHIHDCMSADELQRYVTCVCVCEDLQRYVTCVCVCEDLQRSGLRQRLCPECTPEHNSHYERNRYETSRAFSTRARVSLLE